jgi:hypothetical protein
MSTRGFALVLVAALLAGCTTSEAGEAPNSRAPEGTGEPAFEAEDAPDSRAQEGTGEPDSWRVLAEAPLAPRSGHVAVWTGREMIVWGGSARSDSSVSAEFVSAHDGAAYDPVADSWREISRAPIPGRVGYSAVWTGEEMIVWGGHG